MECSICFNVIQNSSVGSCRHHFCTSCLIEWCIHGGTLCPKCKTFISEIKSDPEFDSINTSNTSNNNIINYNNYNNYTKEIIVNFKQTDIAGITLKNNYKNNTRIPGVKIYKINKKHKCYQSGLKVNDVIMYINKIPCMDHKQAIEIINYCELSSKQMTCLLLC